MLPREPCSAAIPGGMSPRFDQPFVLEPCMKKSILTACVMSLCLFAGQAFAANAACVAKAIDKNGKALAGAAKDSFMKKCEADSGGSAQAACEAKAMDKNGKALAGAAKESNIKKCLADAAPAKK